MGCCAKGVPDVGFSSYTVLTYSLVSEYFGFQEPRLGVGAEGCILSTIAEKWSNKVTQGQVFPGSGQCSQARPTR